MFDLVIIDEATQCNTASALPAFQRGKKVVICGDPKQLRHMSFLSEQRQHLLAEQHQVQHQNPNLLNYRKDSLLDLVTVAIQDQNQVTFLNEHYRSHPSIIQFSNQNFYNSALNVIAATPVTNAEDKIYRINCQGQRNGKGINTEEINSILTKIQEIVATDATTKNTISRTIGILSPFREQVKQLQKEIDIRFESAIQQQHALLIGTPFAFQGEERDIMLLSFAIDSKSHSMAVRHINRADVFNVSITRAKHEQYIYHSVEPSVLKPNTLLRNYLTQKGVSQIAPSQHPSKASFQTDVYSILTANGFSSVYTSHEVANTTIDLLITHNNKNYAVDLIGFPNDTQDTFSLERYKMLHRAGVQVLPLSYSRWRFYKEQAIREIKVFLM